MSYSKTQQRDSGSTENVPPTTDKSITESKRDSLVENSSDIENIEKNAESAKNIDDVSGTKGDSSGVDAEEAIKIRGSKVSGDRKDAKFEKAVASPVLKFVNNILDRHQRTRQLRNSTAKRLLQRAKSNNSNANGRNIAIQCGDKASSGRKFVLPVRSAHSSRVIKPNKRFIEELEESLGGEQCDNEAGKYSKKARTIPARVGGNGTVVVETTGPTESRIHEKEARSKSKKTIATTASDNAERVSKSQPNSQPNMQQDPQASRESSRNESKKHQNKVTSRSLSNSTINVHDPTSGVCKNAEAPIISDKQTSVPTKVLPDLNVPNVESSRVQTRSGTLSDTSCDTNSQVNPETPCEPDASLTRQDGSVADNDSDKTVVANMESDRSQDDGDLKSKCSDDSESESNLSDSDSEHDDHSEDEQSEWTGMKMNGGKVILRKARLKLDNKTISGTEGPFSTTNNHLNAVGNPNPGTMSTILLSFDLFIKKTRAQYRTRCKPGEPIFCR